MLYAKHEAKDWARAHMRGVCNVLLPTFTSDLKRLNEQAIRHDVRRDIELGFWGALVVSECGTTKEEYKQFLDLVIDEAKGRLHAVVHGSFDTLEDVIEVCEYAEQAGASLLLLAYPPTFYPRSERDLYDYMARVLEATRLATVLFAVHQWNFGRVHPAELPPRLVAELAAFPNAVAIKCEGGGPGNGALVEILQRCGDRLLISDPREYNSPAWVQFFGMPWMGTSNYEYFGDTVPRYFRLMHEGRWAEAMELYWQIHPARMARLADMQSYAGANLIHRFSWKFQAWLNGFNGGPLRSPVMRLNDGATRRLRDALVRSKIIPESQSADLGEFFIGRHPA
ncbi:MAG TPA: dihydrodipicolinate synthase family protein [Chloroflexota bacterium]|nr:dihydrodipicolinate synthase family protein [Chloroflexota bacterium]